MRRNGWPTWAGIRTDLGTQALTREVQALRCGLDATTWSGDGARRCSDLLRIEPSKAPSAGALLPFDHARAYALYSALFGEVADLIQGKHLLLVPSGPLTQLPFQVLVTKPSSRGDHKQIAWLARDHALTVLPAVSSLKALRRLSKSSGAAQPMIGIGNPLLDGPDRRYINRARQARERVDCIAPPERRVAGWFWWRSGVAAVARQAGLANVDQIRLLTPLPETADELCAVARDLKANINELRLGARATETEVKAMSASGALAGFRIVHFATHGALAGQMNGSTEPGLILTPPAKGSAEDDGYLSASEIAGLKLDADWVILSACNTAAGGATGAEALSGLARAFFYAQARSLLVSHWEVDSDASYGRKLVTAGIGKAAYRGVA